MTTTHTQHEDFLTIGQGWYNLADHFHRCSYDQKRKQLYEGGGQQSKFGMTVTCGCSTD
jgi:hypothetical protein